MKKKTNRDISNDVHYGIPKVVREIVKVNLTTNEKLKCQHNREVLEDIISDLKQYRDTLPSVADLEAVNQL